MEQDDRPRDAKVTNGDGHGLAGKNGHHNGTLPSADRPPPNNNDIVDSKWWQIIPAREDIIKDARGYTTYFNKDTQKVYCIFDKTKQVYWQLYKPCTDLHNRKGLIFHFDITQRKYKAIVKLEDEKQLILQLKDLVPLDELVSLSQESDLQRMAEDYEEKMQEKSAIVTLANPKNYPKKEDKKRKRQTFRINISDDTESENEDKSIRKLRTNRKRSSRYVDFNSIEEESSHPLKEMSSQLMDKEDNPEKTELPPISLLTNLGNSISPVSPPREAMSPKTEKEYQAEIQMLKGKIHLLENILQLTLNNLQSGVSLIKKFAKKK